MIALKDSYRIDSLVLAVVEALHSKPETELSEAERDVLAIEALEGEVNNGGYKSISKMNFLTGTGFPAVAC